MGSRLSLFCDTSVEASTPRNDLSSTSDKAGVVVMSSPVLSVDPILTFLGSKSVGETSVLLTGALDSSPVSRDCSAKRPTKSPVGGVQMVVWLEGNNREDEVGVLNV